MPTPILNRRVKARRPGAPGGGGPTGLLTPSDFTYLGAYRVPRSPGAGESFYGNGLALRREASDATNPVHLLSAGYNATPNHVVYEWRDATPETHSTTLSAYPEATVVKAYGDIYSGKKRIIYNGVDTPLTSQLDGDLGLYWDAVDSRLYWSYGFGYSSDEPSWCLGYSTLNYAATTGTGFGPWRLTGQSWKALQGGLVGVPSAYATAHAGGKRLAVGMGGYYSLIATCDCSLGPSLTAFDPAALPAEEGSVASTPLVGYWPHSGGPGAGKGRCNRPESAVSLGVGETWGLDKFSWNDRVRGGVWIDNGTKRGAVFFGHYGRGRTQYLSSQIPSSRHGHYWAIYDPNDFAPASGTPRYDIQPASIYDYQYPTIDYTQVQYAQGTSKNISSIASDSGQLQSSNAGCTVSCTGHGLAEGNYLEIFGASVSEYNAIWEIPTGGIIGANSFYIRNTSNGSNWSGSSPTGTITLKRVDNSYDRPLGAAFDATANRLYVAVAVAQGVNNISGHVMVHVYGVAS